MDAVFPSLSERDLARIVDDMNQRGYGVAEGCIDADAMAATRSFVLKAIEQSNGEYVVFAGRENIADGLLASLADAPEFVSACRAIYAKGMGHAGPDTPFYQVLRCLAGKRGERESYIFHYDSFVLTALMPIVIPTEGQAGDLVMLPNTRPVRGSYAVNLVDKLLLDNRLTQRSLRARLEDGRLGATKVRMTPGNIYFFWGCRSIHCNEPCDADKIRATALFHYADPHAASLLRRLLRGDRSKPKR